MKRCILLLIFVALICSACFDQEIEPLQESEVTLKILTDRANAESRYLDVFKLYFPDVNVLFINAGYKEDRESGEWTELFEHHQPDLVMLHGHRDGSIFRKFIELQLVEPLESYILRDGYSFDNMATGAIEWLRMQSPDNQLYALANAFYNEVIFYNTEHFDALNIPYPNEKISWIELLQLARLFQDSEDELYGLNASQLSPLEILYEVAFAVNLNLLDLEKEEVYIRSDAWKEVFEEVVLAYQSGMIDHEIFQAFPEQVAMKISYGSIDEYYSLTLSPTTRYAHWDVIHYPVNTFQSSENHKLRVDYPISIYSESANKEYAWELLKFMTGPELARYELRANPNFPEFPIWISNFEELGIGNVAAFYDVMPSTRENPNDRPEIRPLMQQYLDAVIFEEIELDQALEELEERLMELLKQGALQ